MLPIVVACVVENAAAAAAAESLQQIKEFCESKELTFYTREYNPNVISDDRHFIEKLPAFHIYVKSSYTNTFYMDTHPRHVIRETIEQYLEKEEKEKIMWKKIIGILRIPSQRKKNIFSSPS